MLDNRDDQPELKQLHDALRALEQRLARVEKALAELRPEAPVQHGRGRSLSETPNLGSRAPATGPSAEEATRLTPPPLPSVATAPSAPAPVIPFAQVHDSQPAASAPPPLSFENRSLESIIGQNWASWIGGIVLFLGIVFFLKFAWDQGWIRPSPAARVGIAITCGTILAALGEWMHFRRMREMAAALWGAGVSVIIAAFFAAYAYFQPPVMGQTPAFVGVSITAAVAIVVALHIDVSVVAMLGLVGAYLAPRVLATGQDQSQFLIAYLSVLAGVGLTLGHFKPAWVLLRLLTLVGSYAWLGMWWGGMGRTGAHESLAIVALVVFAAAFVVETAVSLIRHVGKRPWSEQSLSFEFFGTSVQTGPLSIHLLIASLLAIAGSMGLLLWVAHDTGASRVALPALLLAALVAGPGLTLMHLRPCWAAVRWIVLTGSFAWLALWWQSCGHAADQLTLGIAWALGLYVVCLIENLASLRGDHLEAEAPPDVHVAGGSLLVTAGSFGAMLWFWGSADSIFLGTIAIILALVQAGAGLLGRSRAYLISSLLQSTALVTLAVPLLVDEFAITLAWMILAALLAVAGWQLNLRGARAWAAVLLLLALGRAVALDWRNPTLSAVVLTVFGQSLTRWLLVGWTIALLYHLLAWLRPTPGRWPAIDAWQEALLRSETTAFASSPILNYASQVGQKLPMTLDRAGALFAVWGTVIFVLLTASRWSGPPLTLALIGWLAGLLILSQVGRKIGYSAQALVLGILISIRWLLVDNLNPLIEAWSGGGTAAALLNLPAICGVLLAGAVVLALIYAPRIVPAIDSDGQSSRTFLLVWAAAIVFALLNFETIRFVDSLNVADRAIVKQVSLSVLWALVGFAAVLIGFRKRFPELRWAALVLLGITLLKILIIDMSEVRAIWRILSFIAVGALLLGVSFVYHRQMVRSGGSRMEVGG